MTTRRIFLKLAGAVTGLVAASSLVKYAEPYAKLSEIGEWIEDRGDFFIVRVPDYKMFAGEILNKPTIFLLGERAVVKDVRVNGFANVHAPNAGMVLGCMFDTSGMKVARNRPIVEIKGFGLKFERCLLTGNSLPAVAAMVV